jgi:hypothetical protein
MRLQASASLVADAEPFELVQQAKVRPATQRTLPSPEPWATPRRAITGLMPRFRSRRRYLSKSYPRSAYSRRGLRRGRPRRPAVRGGPAPHPQHRWSWVCPAPASASAVLLGPGQSLWWAACPLARVASVPDSLAEGAGISGAVTTRRFRAGIRGLRADATAPTPGGLQPGPAVHSFG